VDWAFKVHSGKRSVDTAQDIWQGTMLNPEKRVGGVEQSEEILEWIWDHFSAVAGDQRSFECWRKELAMTHYAFAE